ncbi:hypothetical protein PsYK624_145250 [Phanerochaete sordida]|uniref:Uncharacterized protein n=1 Tax=Phanerochaete sordida TaxID=48140 RepID=A0A9P3GRY5_9APHY|nr:hypothetical protein PsYK624_145250 [Phanerochaete sordida]
MLPRCALSSPVDRASRPPRKRCGISDLATRHHRGACTAAEGPRRARLGVGFGPALDDGGSVGVQVATEGESDTYTTKQRTHVDFFHSSKYTASAQEDLQNTRIVSVIRGRMTLPFLCREYVWMVATW